MRKINDDNKNSPLGDSPVADVPVATTTSDYSPDWSDEDKKDALPKGADEQILDETGSLGSMDEDVEDIDATLSSVGLHSDENGPRELNMAEDIEANERE